MKKRHPLYRLALSIGIIAFLMLALSAIFWLFVEYPMILFSIAIVIGLVMAVAVVYAHLENIENREP